MKILDHTDTLRALCSASKKWGIYFNIYVPERDPERGWDWDEVPKAAPWLNLEEHGQIIADENGYILFDTEAEMRAIYETTIGDDGPTLYNKYNGPARVYMLTCSPLGELMNENT